MKNIFIDNKDDRPIGVFDSGLGGLTVLNDLAKSFPIKAIFILAILQICHMETKVKTT